MNEDVGVDGQAAEGAGGGASTSEVREFLRDLALQNAMKKRAAGVPAYTVPEAAALLDISQEYLYRLIQADSFPAVHMRISADKRGRYVVPAKAVDRMLDFAAAASARVDAGEWTKRWYAETGGGAA